MLFTRLFAAAALSLGAMGVAAAQSPAEAQAEHALSALSAYYQQIWASLDPTERRAFSAQERAWLNRQRWDEQHQCLAQASGGDAQARSAECQARILERRLQALRSPMAHAARS
ncbi:MAG: hypothetical protein ING59_06830 [Burkholderiales bacterium]|jgi:hypothetical protein|nr:hypothetical protein [Burkholderiales bacterium]